MRHWSLRIIRKWIVSQTELIEETCLKVASVYCSLTVEGLRHFDQFSMTSPTRLLSAQTRSLGQWLVEADRTVGFVSATKYPSDYSADMICGG